MKWTWKEILEHLLSAGVITGAIAFIGQQMGWLRFRKKDNAEIDKIKSEAASIEADIDSKRTDNVVKLSENALTWTVQLAAQLEKANIANEKLKTEIERHQKRINLMKEDFEKQMDVMEQMLSVTRKDCESEKEKNSQLQIQLNKYISGSTGSK